MRAFELIYKAMANKFIHYTKRPKKLSAAFAKAEYDKLLARLPAAEASEASAAWIKLFADYNALESYIGSEAARIGYAYAKNVADKKLEAADRYFSEKIGPAIAEPGFQLAKAFLASKHRSAIAERYGEQLVPIYQTAALPMDPVNTNLRVKATKLTRQYEKMIAQANVKVRGETVNLYKARSFQFYSDGALRKESYLAGASWFLKNRPKLAAIYAQLVALRTQMAKNVGLDNYTLFSYQAMGRQGYGPAEVKKFRQLVLKHLVPLYNQIAKDQAEHIGAKSLRPWDLAYDPALTVPSGTAPVKTQLDQAQAVFEKVSPILARHFKDMRRDGLIDLETRANKKSGAFCTDFSDEAKVAILCNSTGDPDDVRTLTHEMGHAFQGVESMHIEAVDLQWGSYELAEVYSMGMEFLSLPYMNEFFDAENTRKFTKYKWVDSIFTICYVCIVDEFQHWVYESPEATTTQRDKQWDKIHAKYFGAVDYSGIKKYRKARWYAQGHIFSSPFYYIDYALAELCAMQFGVLSAENQKKAVEKYLEMCKLGGTKSFLETLSYAGLKNPFDETLIKDIAKYVKDVMAQSN